MQQHRRWLVIGAVILATLGVGTAPASANHGADPIDRYWFQDSREVGGPTFHPRPAPLGLPMGDDDEVGFGIGFDFHYYASTVTSVRVGANGALLLGGGVEDVAGSNQALTAGTQDMIAPWWDDWDPDAAGSVSVGTSGLAGHQVFTVWWHNVAHFGGDPATVSFQAQLFEGSDRIEFHYLDASHPTAGNGVQGTVGLDNGTHSALQYSFNTARLRDGLVIAFQPARCDGEDATHIGTFGHDTVTGTSGDDVIVTLGGADTVNAGGGEDVVCSGSGNDTVNGGGGTDLLFGESGNDILRGGLAADLLSGAAGNDQLVGGPSQDTCAGGAGQDTAATCEVRSGLP